MVVEAGVSVSKDGERWYALSSTGTDEAERTMIGQINFHEVFKGKLPLGSKGSD
jgi:hypothetical protein